LEKDGVTFPDNKRIRFDSLNTRSGGVIHAEGISEDKKFALSFGPLHGAISTVQVIEGLRESYMGGFDEVIFCGFAFDPEAQATISENPNPRIKAHASHIRPDIIMTDAKGDSLLKTTASSQLFTVFGEPDIEIEEIGKGKDKEYLIRLLGVDVYDPVDGTVHSENAGRVAAWFVDTDYNGQTFWIRQAFFPNKSAWNKIEKALKGTLDKEQFDKLTGQESLSFKSGEYKRAAVKVIDQRGNEVMKVVRLDKNDR
jgi:adenine-specific DNA-methyltransferase